MHAPSSAVRLLGQQLLLHAVENGKAGGGGHRGGHRAVTAVAMMAATERATREVGQPLSRLVGMAGCQALLARALYLAGREWPVLAGVRAAATPAGGLEGLEGLEEALRGADAARARDALAAVLAHLVWLLITFIGDALVLHTLREAWPDLRLGPDALSDTGAPNNGRLREALR